MNEIFNLVKSYGLQTTDFGWDEAATKWPGSNGTISVQQLVHRPTGYFFKFDCYGRVARPSYQPGKEQAAAEIVAGAMGSWESVLEEVEKWVESLRDEVSEPDLWALAQDDKKLITARIDELDNTSFSAEEQARVKLGIAELSTLLKSTGKHSGEQLKFIDSRLKHLEEASGRLGRKDWITLAMGTLANIVVGLALAPEMAKELVRTAGSLFGWVVGSVQLLL